MPQQWRNYNTWPYQSIVWEPWPKHQSSNDVASNKVWAVKSTSSISERVNVTSDLLTKSKGLQSCKVSNATMKLQNRWRKDPLQLIIMAHPVWRKRRKLCQLLQLGAWLGRGNHLLEIVEEVFCCIPKWQQDRRSRLIRTWDFKKTQSLLLGHLETEGVLTTILPDYPIILARSATWFSSCHNSTASHSPQAKTGDG